MPRALGQVVPRKSRQSAPRASGLVVSKESGGQRLVGSQHNVDISWTQSEEWSRKPQEYFSESGITPSCGS